MRTFEIIPHKGVGPVKFGMEVHEVEAVIGKPKYTHANRYDYLSGFMVDFDESGKVAFLELANSPKFQATYRGANLHSMKADDAIKFMSQFDTYDANNPEIGYSYLFKNLQLSLWRGTMPENDFDEDGIYFEAVGIGADNYFD